MAKGENIFKRKDGRWEARYVKGRELDGKIRYGFCYGKSYKEAKDKVTAVKAALLMGYPAETGGGRQRLATYCDAWLEDCKYKVKESTYVKYEAILRVHIKPSLGSCHPKAISEEAVRDFTQVLLQTLSPKTTKDVLMVLHSVLKFAQKQTRGYFPNVEIPYPKEQRKEMRVLTEEEQKVLTRRLLRDGDVRELGILLALLTGMRIGELCALRWEDVSLDQKVVHVCATMQRLRC